MPLASSGTSKAKSFSTNSERARETIISGPRCPSRTSATKTLSRWFIWYSSWRTCSEGGIIPWARPRSTTTMPFSRRKMWPLIISPIFCWYSSTTAFFSDSRTRCSKTCLAVWAAMRPKPGGVASSSFLKTLASPVWGSISARSSSISPP